MKMTQAQYDRMWRNINFAGITMYGELIAEFPDEVLSKEERELKANVLRCQKLQKAAQEKQQVKAMRAFDKFLGLA